MDGGASLCGSVALIASKASEVTGIEIMLRRQPIATRPMRQAERNRSCSVLPLPLSSAMSDDDELVPARAEDLRACIAYALTSDGRLAKTQSAELMASIVAERLIARLERDGFVIMRRPGLGGHSALGRGFEPRSG